MKRIYHSYEKWECFPAGFFNNSSGEIKKVHIQKVIELFSNPALTLEYMSRVIDEWKYSCEHNLTNESMNKIAWLGQSACCLFAGIPSTVTMEAWRLVPLEFRNIADEIAKGIIEKYESQHLIQLEHA